MRRLMMMLLLGAWALAGCNTLQGMGEDLKQGGQTLEKAVNKE